LRDPWLDRVAAVSVDANPWRVAAKRSIGRATG
jgi:hypothetical protein